jgi:periplasmic divalent cation tolerance protein
MSDHDSLVICLTTVAMLDDADRVAAILLDRSVAACVQIEGPIRSHYLWEHQRRCDEEYRLVIKSSLRAWPLLQSILSDVHPYDEPQILMWVVSDSAQGYREWILSQTIRP